MSLTRRLFISRLVAAVAVVASGVTAIAVQSARQFRITGFRIWRRALTEKEIHDMWFLGKEPPP